MSGVTQKAGPGGEMEVEGDSFSINRFAQGLLGDFLRKVLGPSRTRSNLVDKAAAFGAWSSPLDRVGSCAWFMCYRGLVHRPVTAQDELTRSQRATNERLLFHTHPCFKDRRVVKSVKKRAWHQTLHHCSASPHPPCHPCHPWGVALIQHQSWKVVRIICLQ